MADPCEDGEDIFFSSARTDDGPEEHNVHNNDNEEHLSNSLEYNIVLNHHLLNERCTQRRHSHGDNISPLIPVHVRSRTQRRCSLQIPPCLHENNQSNHQTHNIILNNSQPSMVGIGSELFIAFLHEEINRSHLEAPEYLTSSTRESNRSLEYLNLGAHLRLMADEFANSDHRRRVRDHAESISLASLDSESFTDLLFGMFQRGGVTWERILVLFVFCSDLSLRALRERLAVCFANLMHWSQMYIESWLTPWVQRHGGWTVLLERSVDEAYRAAVIGACMMGMLALWTYIRTAGH